MTRTGQSATLSQHLREPLVEIHPDDAASRGLADGGLARVSTAQGDSLFRVSVHDGQRRGDLFVPIHWTDQMSSGGRAGRLPGQRVDPHSGQPAFKNCPAQITPFATDWRAFMVSVDRPALPGDVYWTVSRVKGGWMAELAGQGAIDAAAIIGGIAMHEVADSMRGMRRLAMVDADNCLTRALYVTRQGILPSRAWIASQLGLPVETMMPVLAGRTSGAQIDAGPIVCVCMNVGERAICGAVASGCADVAAVGTATGAGTNCGSCRPAIARLIAAFTPEQEMA